MEFSEAEGSRANCCADKYSAGDGGVIGGATKSEDCGRTGVRKMFEPEEG